MRVNTGTRLPTLVFSFRALAPLLHFLVSMLPNYCATYTNHGFKADDLKNNRFEKRTSHESHQTQYHLIEYLICSDDATLVLRTHGAVTNHWGSNNLILDPWICPIWFTGASNTFYAHQHEPTGYVHRLQLTTVLNLSLLDSEL